MTRALVVFESMYGNTEAVARAIADGLALGASRSSTSTSSPTCSAGSPLPWCRVGDVNALRRDLLREDRAPEPLADV